MPSSKKVNVNEMGEAGPSTRKRSASAQKNKSDGGGESSTLTSNIPHNPSKLGRKGDPRMHAAVAARLANPDMSLLDALRKGGFVFPDLDSTDGTVVVPGGDEKIYDADKVQLCQRKNQLSRRLRLARQSQQGGGGGKSPGKGKRGGKGAQEKQASGTKDAGGIGSGPNVSGLGGRQSSVSSQNSGGSGGSSSGLLRPLRAKRTASVLSVDGNDGVEEMHNAEANGFDQEEIDAALGQVRMAKNHPLFAAQQAAAAAGVAAKFGAGAVTPSFPHHQAAAPGAPVGPWGGAVGGVMASTPADRAAAVPAAVATLQQLQGLQAQVAAAAAGAQSFFRSNSGGLQGTAAAGGSSGLQLAGMNSADLTANHLRQFQSSGDGGSNNITNGTSAAAAAPVNVGQGGIGSFGGNAQALFAMNAAQLGLSREQLAQVLSSGGIGNMFSAMAPGNAAAAAVAAAAQNQQTAAAAAKQNQAATAAVAQQNQASFPPAPSSATSGPVDTGLPSEMEGKMLKALNLHSSESTLLLQRCMLLAGFGPSEAKESELAYLEFSHRATEAERQRVRQLRAAAGLGSSGNGPQMQSDAIYSGQQQPQSSGMCGGHNNHSYGNPSGNGEKGASNACFDGKHVHQLMGKCGHKAIIHQPQNGPAHVDFVVDGKVECYEGIMPVGKSSAKWPSKFSCSDLACKTGQENDHEVTCGEDSCTKECTTVPRFDPKVFDLNEIDFNGNEWTFDVAEGDETLLGLMKLGDTSTTAV